jgi:SAM-dependent methyltransferase
MRFDIAEGSVATGARIAAEKNLPIAYGVQDLNRCKLAPGKYDLVAAQTCLHHIVELEYLADQIHQSLQPDGYLWIHDFIGETKFQFVEERIRICNDLLNILPPEFRVNRFTNKTLDAFKRPHPDRLASPFEAIRSAEILPVFLERFEIVERSESSALLHIICPPGYRQNYVEQPNGQVIFDLLHYLDRLVIRKGILPPLGGQYIMRPTPLK